MTLTEIRQVLADRGLHPNKRLGQNFLHDQNLCDWIASLCGDTAHVVEVGPGLGALTRSLRARGIGVLAIELDKGFAAFLREAFEGDTGFALTEGDALEVLGHCADQARVLVGNLPYNISTPLIMTVAALSPPPDRMVLTLQLEMAERICAKHGSKDFGAVSVLVQSRYAPAIERRLDPSVFFPKPEVRSAVVTLVRKDTSGLPPWHKFESFVRRGFSAKRKMLVNCLSPTKGDREAWRAAVAGAGLNPMVRAEDVPLEIWPALYEAGRKIS